MLPILFTIGSVKIYTFGVFLVLAFFWGSFFLWKLIRLTSFKEEEVFDGLFWSLFGGFSFGRIVYVILNFRDFGFNLAKFILINGYPGLSLYGVLIGGILTLSIYFRRLKLNFREIIDYFIPPILTAMAVGELGGFFSGIEKSYASLLESIFFFLAVFLSYKLIFEIRKEKLNHGFNLWFFLWYFSLVDFIFDKVKVNHLYFLGYSVNKVVSATLLLTISLYFLYYFRSLIFLKIRTLKNFLIKHGQVGKTIYRGTKEKTNSGQGKNSPTD